MDTKHELITKLSEALKPTWATLPEETKETVKALSASINAGLLALSAQPLPEAPVSANFRVVHQESQAEVKFTVRGHTYQDVKANVVLALVDLTSTGWQTFDKYVDQRKAERSQQQPVTMAVSATAQQGSGDGVFTCHAKELLAMPKSTSDSTLIWKVMTDKSKYPVAMYEETAQGLAGVLAAAGIDVNTFVVNGQPAKYNLSGWTAHYVKKEGTDFPKKIVNLTH